MIGGFSEEDIKNGIKDVIWQGRFEVINQNPLTIIDGAHNVAGVSALCQSLREYFPQREFNFVTATFKDKGYKKTIAILEISLSTTLILPLLSVYVVKGDNGFAIALLTFFVFNPLAAIIIGIIAGFDIRSLFWAPLAFSLLFWIFAMLIFDPAFPLVYSAIYLVISLVSMMITLFVRKIKNRP